MRVTSLRKRRSNVISPQIIFFDFDGVLVESVEIKNYAFRKLYAEHGEGVVEKVLAHHAEHGGISRVVKIQHCHWAFLGIDLTHQDLTALTARFADDVEELVIACPSVEGTMEMLAAERMGRRLYIVSGTPEDELQRILDAPRDGHGSPDGYVQRRQLLTSDLGRRIHGRARFRHDGD